MHSFIFLFTVDTSIWGYKVIIVCLSAWPLSGLVSKADPPPVCLLPGLERSDFCPLLFIFTRCIPTPWPFGKNLRIPIRSWDLHFQFFWCPPFSVGGSKVAGEFSFILLMFSGSGSEVVGNISSHSHTIWLDTFLLPDPPILLAVSDLVASLLFSSACSSVNGLFSCHLFLGGIQSSHKEWFALVSGFPGSLLLAVCSSLPSTKKVSMGRFPSIWQAFECSRLDSFYVRRRG